MVKEFKLGQIVWDNDNQRYGIVLAIFVDFDEVRLDSDGVQGTDWLYPLGDKKDLGTPAQLQEAIECYNRLLNDYPNNGYPQIILPEMTIGNEN